MQIERRAYKRQPVRWEATVSSASTRPVEVVIRDFCDGGLFLARASSRGGSFLHRGLHIDDRVKVQFENPLRQGSREIQARVARVTREGLGIAFLSPLPEVTTLLGALAEGQAEAGGQSDGDAGSRLSRDALGLVNQAIREFLESRLPEFAHQTVEHLYEGAQAARDNAEQNAYFSGYRYMRNARQQVLSEFLEHMTGKLADLASGRVSSGGTDSAESAHQEMDLDNLSLVDENEFEDWLARSEAVTKAEGRHAPDLELLNRRLSYVCGRRLTEATNPIAPAGLAECLSSSLDTLALEHLAQQAIYTVFGRTLLRDAGQLYADLNAGLRDRGVLPNLEKEIHKVGRGGSAAPSEAETEAQREAEAEDPQASQPAPQDEPPAPDVGPQAPPAPAPGWSSPGPRGPGPGFRGGAASAPQPAAAGGPSASAIRQLVPAARDLAHLRERLAAQRAAMGGHSSGAPATGASAQGAATATYQREEIVRAVNRLQSQLQTDSPAPAEGLRERLLDTLRDVSGNAANKELAPEQTEQVNLLGSWFEDLGRDAVNTDFIRDWSGRMAVLALKVQLENGGFLKSEPQPIHDLLNQLDRAGVALATVRGPDRDRLRVSVERQLSRVLDEYARYPDVYIEASQEIAELVEKPLRTRAVNMQKVLQQCEGTQKLERAQRAVRRELDRRVAGHRIPELVRQFLDQGWRHLLVLVYLRVGPKDDQWRRGLGVVDRLLAALGRDSEPPRGIPEPDKVLAHIERQLTAFGRYSQPMQELTAKLRDLVMGVCRDGRLPEPIDMVQMPEVHDPSEDELKRISSRWLGQAKLLKVGDWVFFSGKSGTPEPLRLQWIAEDRSRFVFVNRSGIKARDLSLAELSRHLEAAAASVTEDMDAPLTERQWQKKLQEMHDELVRYATHDSLTGCLNRKAMRRRLDGLPQGRAAEGETHVLCYFSVDGFKVVNATLGHDQGDRLLQEFARMLTEAADADAAVGRMGGDEFAVLLANRGAEGGRKFAEEQCQRLRAHRVGEGSERISVTTSVGVVPFSLVEQGPENVLKDADEACLAAKQAGGNRVHVLTSDDTELAELRSSMARAARVDSALEAGTLRLRAQRIMPLDVTSHALSYFEVLVAIQGAAEELIPPAEFIPAAERFGRMTAVDRWVIREVLVWCSDHPRAMSEIQGICINLSGPTLNDETFAPYLAAELAAKRVPGNRICFEVTETAAVQNLARAADLIEEVKELGCQFSLDDFGTGLSSYSYLKNLPVDFLKIDGQFIRDITTDEADYAMVRSINELGHFLGKRTVAEFVESEEILARLTEIGLDYGQGYGIARPIPLNDLAGQL